MSYDDKTKRRRILKTTPALLGLIAGCTGGQEQSTPTSSPTPTETPEEDTPAATPSHEDAVAELIQKAEDEGEVVVRVPAHGDTSPLIGGFLTRDTDVEYTQFGGSTIQHIAQVKTELAVGKLSSDVFMTTAPTDRALAVTEGIMEPNAFPPAVKYGKVPDLMKPEWDEKDRFINLTASGRPLAYNTDLVSEDEVPRTWDEILDPKWENSYLIDTDTVIILEQLMRDLGSVDKAEQWLKDFRPQIKRFKTSSFSGTQDLSAGRAKFFLGAPSSLVNGFKRNEGAPIDMSYTNNTAYLTVNSLGMFRDPPHPNAGRLFLEWALRPEVMEENLKVAGDYSMDPSLWPDNIKEIEETGTLYVVDVPFNLESERQLGLTRGEMLEEFQALIGVK